MATKRHITERDIEAARNLKRIYEHRKYGTERMTQRKKSCPLTALSGRSIA
jgi:hypothetical protein